MRDAVSVATAEDAVRHLSLEGVRFYALGAEQTDEAMRSDSEPSEGNLHAETAYRTSPDGVEYRCALTAETEGRKFHVDGVVSYTSDVTMELEPQAAAEFGTRVAVMTLYPYLRQQVSDLAARLGLQLTLPMIRPGDILIEAADE